MKEGFPPQATGEAASSSEEGNPPKETAALFGGFPAVGDCTKLYGVDWGDLILN